MANFLKSEFSVISPAMFNVYNECPLKFYYQYVKQISSPSLDENFIEGKNLHGLASYFLRGNDVSKYEKVLTQREVSYWEYLKQVPYFKYEIEGVESSLSMRIEDYWIGGRIDAIVRKGKEYYILDYKTGGVSSDKTYDYQTMVYLLLCDELFKERTSLNFIYLDLRNKKEVCITFDKVKKQEYLERLLNACKGMSNISKEVDVCPEFNCSYNKLCLACVQDIS